MIDRIKKINTALPGLLFGIILFGMLCQTLNSAVERDVKGAQAVATRQNIIRYLVVVIILGSLMVTRIGSPLAAFAGVMGLKISAYLQPLFAGRSHKEVQGNTPQIKEGNYEGDE